MGRPHLIKSEVTINRCSAGAARGSAINLLYAALLPVAASASGWFLHKLSLDAYPNARCLDGTPGAFYILPGDSSWVLHLQGGGWCTSMSDCAERSKYPVYAGEPSIGSTFAWADPAGAPCSEALSHTAPPCGSDGGSGGLFSSSNTLNPLFANATKVWLGYCSGDGFSGTRVGPQTVNGSFSVYFGGAFILDAILRELLNTHGMNTAGTVLLKGCSAGGASTFAHADSVGAIVKAGTGGPARYAALPGAGFLLDVPSYNSAPNFFATFIPWVYKTMGANTSCNDLCVSTYESKEYGSSWKCFLPQYSLPFIATPLFVVNSAADAAQMGLLNLDCNPQRKSDCNSSQLAYLDNFRDEMKQLLAPVLSSNGKHGAFLLECYVHMMENVDGAWSEIPVGGRTAHDVFASWWRKDGGAVVAVDSSWTRGDPVVGGNPLCGRYGPLPSWPSY